MIEIINNLKKKEVNKQRKLQRVVKRNRLNDKQTLF